MTAHTPGPWHVSDNGFRVKGGDFDFLQVTNEGAPAEEWGANARLIAAAPDMLATLKEAETALAYAVVALEAPERSSIRKTLDDVRAAIAKAEGKP